MAVNLAKETGHIFYYRQWRQLSSLFRAIVNPQMIILSRE
jgi:hypothetical protein